MRGRGENVGLVLLGLCLFCPWAFGQGEESITPRNQKPELVLADAVLAIQRRALVPRTETEIIVGLLDAYARTLDPHSRYLRADDVKAMDARTRGVQEGLGLEVIRSSFEPQWICLPQVGGPAQIAGVRMSDVLVSIGQRQVEERTTVDELRDAARPENGRVAIAVRRPGFEAPLTFQVEPKNVPVSTVFSHRTPEFSVARITRFTVGTARDLEAAVASGTSKTLVLDVRGNGGGDLESAAQSAALFVRSGSVLLSVESRAGKEVRTVDRDGAFLDRRVFLLQDEHTASAAEVFVAALVMNGRATSIGRLTRGKGTRQSMVPLVDGSALLLTTGALLAPDGKSFDGVGLLPTVAIRGVRNESEFLAAAQSTILERIGGPAVPRRHTPGDLVYLLDDEARSEAGRPQGAGFVFEAQVVDQVEDQVTVRLLRRFRFMLAPDAPEGLDARGLWPVPIRSLTYVEVDFDPLVTKRWRGEVLDRPAAMLRPVPPPAPSVLESLLGVGR